MVVLFHEFTTQEDEMADFLMEDMVEEKGHNFIDSLPDPLSMCPTGEFQDSPGC